MKQGWEIKKLGEVCNINYGTRVVQKKDGGTVYPVYGGGGATFKMDRYNREDCLIVSRFAMSNQCVRYVSGKFFLNDSGLTIESNELELSQPFLDKHIIALNDTIYSLGKGVAQKNLDIKELKLLDIKFPKSLEEQERIVAELDCLSGVIERKREQLRELDALAQSIFHQMFGDPITNEKRWEVKKLGEVGKVITGNTPSTKDEENYSSNDYCFVKPSDIGKDYVTKIENTEFYISEKAFSQSRRLSKGSVLTTCIGIIGKVGILKVDATCNQQINAILPDENSISEYVAWAIYLTRSVLENIANAPVVPIINKGEFSNIVIPLPPKALQQEFADKIEAIEKQKELIKKSISETENLFNARMDYYFN